ncbi:MAG: hypothetical protein Q7U89_04690 [Coriobacteriia bacterium]|nr:hypothetical protein [Coriobacteriia bacterium]
MNRVYEYDEWISQRRGSVRAIARAATESPRRGRKRTAEELRMLEISALASIARREREGRLTRSGPREYSLKG